MWYTACVFSTALSTTATSRAACGELAACLLLDGAAADSRSISQAISPAIVAEGWRAGGEPPSERDIAWVVGDLLCAAESLGLVARQVGRSRYPRDRLVLTPAGRAGLAAGLRARALAPARAIWRAASAEDEPDDRVVVSYAVGAR